MTTEHDPLPSRREVLTKGAAGAFALATLGMTSAEAAVKFIPPPGITEGPYWVEELLVRSDIRLDPVTGIWQDGFPIYLGINVWQLHNNVITPLKNVVLDLWQCNAHGVYSDEAVEGTLGQKFLRGTQVTPASGSVWFLTNYPGWYSGRTPHIHVRARVWDATTDTITYNFVTQLFFNDAFTNSLYFTTPPYNQRPYRDTYNQTDNIYTGASEDGEIAAEAGEYLTLQLSDKKTHGVTSYNIILNLSDSGYNNALGGKRGPRRRRAGWAPARVIADCEEVRPELAGTRVFRGLESGQRPRNGASSGSRDALPMTTRSFALAQLCRHREAFLKPRLPARCHAGDESGRLIAVLVEAHRHHALVADGEGAERGDARRRLVEPQQDVAWILADVLRHAAERRDTCGRRPALPDARAVQSQCRGQRLPALPFGSRDGSHELHDGGALAAEVREIEPQGAEEARPAE